jgi:hypothetical protein
MLKRIKNVEAKVGLKKETVPVANLDLVCVVYKQATYDGIRMTENVPADQIKLRTDSGEVMFPIADCEIRGLVSVYCEAEANLKEATAIVDSLKPMVCNHGVIQIIDHNCSAPHNPWTSVKIKDVTFPEGEDPGAARVSSTVKYKFGSADAVSLVFDALRDKAVSAGMAEDEAKKKYNVNDYIQETVVASFDNKFFLNKEGDFDQKRYDMVQAALDTVAKKLNATNPLTCKTVVLPKPDFHEKRYSNFTAEENLRIHSVMPNVCSVSAQTHQ